MHVYTCYYRFRIKIRGSEGDLSEKQIARDMLVDVCFSNNHIRVISIPGVFRTDQGTCWTRGKTFGPFCSCGQDLLLELRRATITGRACDGKRKNRQECEFEVNSSDVSMQLNIKSPENTHFL